jgi:hypothetical protein
MKRVIVLLLVVFVMFISMGFVSAGLLDWFKDVFGGGITGRVTASETSCSDSDGINYYSKGTVTVSYSNGSTGTFDDYCWGSDDLRERTCTGNIQSGEDFYCNTTCTDGKCDIGDPVQPKTITSCDGEYINYYIKDEVVVGYSDGSSETFTDYCTSSTQVMEYYCSGNTFGNRTYDNCFSGCQDGICHTPDCAIGVPLEEDLTCTCQGSDVSVPSRDTHWTQYCCSDGASKFPCETPLCDLDTQLTSACWCYEKTKICGNSDVGSSISGIDTTNYYCCDTTGSGTGDSCQSDACVPAGSTCGVNNPNDCLTEVDCTGAGLYWCNVGCRVSACAENETVIADIVKEDVNDTNINKSSSRDNNVDTNVNKTIFDTKLEINEDLENNETRIKVKLSTGVEQVIVVSPKDALQIAVNELGSTNNLTFELSEISEGDNVKAVFSAKVDKSGKFLGIFSLNVILKTLIDAETGEVLETDKPWWAFLVVYS